ncbi:MAG: hypothetical protein M0T77_13180 [Actinomycetota bacterium]|nr:hypothetical protein [Actinomycetota bacterium]
MEDRDHIQRRLRAANRVPGAAGDTATPDAVLDQLGARIMTDNVVHRPAVAKTQRRARLRVSVVRRGAVLSSVIGVLIVGGALAATVALTVPDGAAGSCQTL